MSRSLLPGAGVGPPPGPPFLPRRTHPAALALLAALLLSACMTVGQEFAFDRIAEVKVGQSTQQDVKALFGEPVRIGIEEGRLSWTYLHFQAGLFRDLSGQDLVIKFDSQGRVHSLSYHSSDTARVLPRSG